MMFAFPIKENLFLSLWSFGSLQFAPKYLLWPFLVFRVPVLKVVDMTGDCHGKKKQKEGEIRGFKKDFWEEEMPASLL